jgi:hypothetical protein
VCALCSDRGHEAVRKLARSYAKVLRSFADWHELKHFLRGPSIDMIVTQS